MTFDDFRAALSQLTGFDPAYREAITDAAQGQSEDVLDATLLKLIDAHSALTGLDKAPPREEIAALTAAAKAMRRDIRNIRESDERDQNEKTMHQKLSE